MSTNAEQVVREFFEKCAQPGQLIPTFEQYLGEGCVWENSGFPTMKGKAECMTLIKNFSEGVGFETIRVEYRAIAASGNTILTERLDYFIDGNGTEVATLAVSGTLDVEAGQITCWRDYFDPRPFLSENG